MTEISSKVKGLLERSGFFPHTDPNKSKFEQYAIDSRGLADFRKVMGSFEVPDFCIGGVGYPDSYLVHVKEILSPSQIDNLFFDFSISEGTPTIRLEKYISKLNLMASPAIVSGGVIFELPVTQWSKESGEWLWTVVESQDNTPSVKVLTSGELLKRANNPKPLPADVFNYNLNLPDPKDEDETTIIQAMKIMQDESRRIPFQNDAVMIFSNDDKRINEARSRVASCLWKIISTTSKVIGKSPPTLFCNGYQWNIDNMREVALTFGIDTKFIRDVVLPEGSNTTSHGLKMIEQVSPLPNRLTLVTSVEHLMRSAINVHNQVSLPRDVFLSYFQVPTLSSEQDKVVTHEIQRLKAYSIADIKRTGADVRLEWDSWAIPRAVPLWARACVDEKMLVKINS